MRQRALLGLIAVGALGCEAPPMTPFEGEIHSIEYSGGGALPLRSVWLVRGSMWRQLSDLGPSGRYLIENRETGRQVMVIPEQRRYSVYQESYEDPLPGYWAGIPRRITLTDREETIAGHRCRIVTFDTREGDVVEHCFTTELVGLSATRAIEVMVNFPLDGSAVVGDVEGLAAFKAFFGNDAFLLRSVTIRGATRHLESEVVQVVPRQLGAELFAVPKGFRED